jgi:hypothetical protein
MAPTRNKGARRGGGGGGGGGGRSVAARNDAEEASQDALAEMDDTAAALNGAGDTTGEPVGARAPPELPEGLWKRRVAKEKQDKEQALKEKELLQKRLDEMAAQLELAKASVGDVVPGTPTSNKVYKNCVSFYACNAADYHFLQRQKTVAAVRTGPAIVSAMLPIEGNLLEVLTGRGQSYIRDIQRDLVPRSIAVSGFRWHNGVNRGEMIQILRYLTIRKGGIFAHWDALDARSGKFGNANQLATKIAGSHAHAARNHQEFVRGKVVNLFKHTPDDKQINFVKEEVFGITDGNPIISPDHPVMVEMFELPIVGALC